MTVDKALKVFGFSKKSSLKEANLRLSYIKLAKERHPDKSGSNQEFVELREAYELLTEYLKVATLAGLQNDIKNTNSFSSKNKNISVDGFFQKFGLEKFNDYCDLDNKKVVITDSSYQRHLELLDFIKEEVSKAVKALEIEKKELENEKESEISKLHKKYVGGFGRFWNFAMKSGDFLKEKALVELKYEEIKGHKDTTVYQELVKKYSQVLDDITGNLEVVQSYGSAYKKVQKEE
jgi:curved DNA-binding protein CbpA